MHRRPTRSPFRGLSPVDGHARRHAGSYNALELKWPLGDIKSLGKKCGSARLALPGITDFAVAGKTSITESIQREVRRVVTASELASRLGPTKGGVRILFVGLGEDVYELELPYISLPRLREPIMPADWTRPPSTPTNGKTNPEPSPPPSRLTKDLADQIRQRRR
jgi:hypothetical protein